MSALTLPQGMPGLVSWKFHGILVSLTLISQWVHLKGPGSVFLFSFFVFFIFRSQFAKTSAAYYPTILCWLMSGFNQSLRKYVQSTSESESYPATIRNCSCLETADRTLRLQPQLLTKCHEPIINWFLYQQGFIPNPFQVHLTTAGIPLCWL